jgi:hypothetical protein
MLLIDAIAHVETHNRVQVGDHGAALSKFQIHSQVWQDVHRRWGHAGCASIIDVGQRFEDIGGDDQNSQIRARNCATCHVVIIKEYLLKHNIPCTADNIYCCWNLGCKGYFQRRFDLSKCPAGTMHNAIMVEYLADHSPAKPQNHREISPQT